jgi:hemolysin III
MEHRTPSLEELSADAVIHITCVAMGTVAASVMMAAAIALLAPPISISLGIYAAGMLTMFGCSAANNMNRRPARANVLRRLDHAAIFLKIAGTYTPFGVILGGAAGYLLLGVVWSVALVAAAGKLFTTSWRGLDIALYLALGWVGLLAYRPLSQVLPTSTLTLLAVGGVLYSVGVIFHLWRELRFQNAIWHAFVLVATGCHFGAVATAAFA